MGRALAPWARARLSLMVVDEGMPVQTVLINAHPDLARNGSRTTETALRPARGFIKLGLGKAILGTRDELSYAAGQ